MLFAFTRFMRGIGTALVHALMNDKDAAMLEWFEVQPLRVYIRKAIPR